MNNYECEGKMIVVQNLKSGTGMENDLESEPFHVLFVSYSVSFGFSSSFSTSVDLHVVQQSSSLLNFPLYNNSFKLM